VTGTGNTYQSTTKRGYENTLVDQPAMNTPEVGVTTMFGQSTAT